MEIVLSYLKYNFPMFVRKNQLLSLSCLRIMVPYALCNLNWGTKLWYKICCVFKLMEDYFLFFFLLQAKISIKLNCRKITLCNNREGRRDYYKKTKHTQRTVQPHNTLQYNQISSGKQKIKGNVSNKWHNPMKWPPVKAVSIEQEIARSRGTRRGTNFERSLNPFQTITAIGQHWQRSE